MFGKSRIGDSVAAEMDRILGDSEFQSVFSKPELTDDYNQALAQDAGYRAFVRVASKKDKDKDKKDKDKKDKDKEDEVGKDDEEKKSKARPPAWLRKKREDASGEDIYDDDYKPEKKDKKKEAALALDYILKNLNKTSEVLDNLGFNKSATVALALINGIYREASIKLADDGMESRVSELQEKSPDDLLEKYEEDEDEQEYPMPSIGEGSPKMPEMPKDPAAPTPPEEEDPDTEPAGPYGDLFADDEDNGDEYSFPIGQADDSDAGSCGSMMASASDKSKDKEQAKKVCAAEAKKLMKKHGCKGTAKVTDKGVEVTCKGEKNKCDKCCKEIHAFCKKHKVSCKLNKEYADKKIDKKAFVVRNKAVLAAMNELEDWLKEG